MSLLRSYSFGAFNGVNELPVEVLNLFKDVSADDKIEYASEIIFNGLQGRIDFSREFNLKAYEATIRKNQRLGTDAEKKKRSWIDFDEPNSDDYSETVTNGGISVNELNTRAVDKVEDAFEQYLDDEELLYAIDTIKSLQPQLLAEAQVDLIGCIRQALKEVPQAVKALKEVCEEFPLVSEMVEIVLSSNRSFEECFAM